MNRKIIMFMNFYRQTNEKKDKILDCEIIIKENNNYEFFTKILYGYGIVLDMKRLEKAMDDWNIAVSDANKAIQSLTDVFKNLYDK